MPTIRDVAAHAQVSPGTVSQLLNGRASVRPETRSRIEQAIAQLGYQPGRVGRPRTRPATANVALVFSESGTPRQATLEHHPLSRRRIRYIREALIESGDHFSLFFLSENESERNLVFREAIEAGDVHGVIYAPSGKQEGWHAQWLRERNVPTVRLQRVPAANEFSHVSLDDAGGGRQAAAHLLELGHRRLAHVPVHRPLDWAEARQRGFLAEAERADAPTPAVRPLDPDAGLAAAQPICQSLLEEGVTGIFASNDGVAVMCVDALERLGARVPQDVSVIGFDNMHYSSESGLVPTSLGYEARHFAQVAVRFVKQLIAESHHLAQAGAFIRTRLVQHDTTGPLPEV